MSSYDEQAQQLLDLSAAVLVSPRPDMTPATPEQADVAVALLGHFDELGAATGWTRQELIDLIGCNDPNPLAWLEARLDLLKRSLEVVAFLASATTRSAAMATPPEAAHAAQLMLVLSLECISRAGGNAPLAMEALTVANSEGATPIGLVAVNRLGSARKLMRRFLNEAYASNPGEDGRQDGMAKTDDSSSATEQGLGVSTMYDEAFVAERIDAMTARRSRGARYTPARQVLQEFLS